MISTTSLFGGAKLLHHGGIDLIALGGSGEISRLDSFIIGAISLLHGLEGVQSEYPAMSDHTKT